MPLSDSDITFAQRISQHPSLKNRIELLMNVLEDCAGDCQKANEAELRVIEELRQLGNEALHCWAERKVEQVAEDFGQAHGATKSGKKNFGGIPPSERWPFMSKSLGFPGNDSDPLASWRKCIAEAAQGPCNGW
jgi:hypothetical protein